MVLFYKKAAVLILLFSFIGCGVYTFGGSTLPSHLKTVNIPLFINATPEPGVAELITENLNRKIRNDRLLQPVSSNSDASITGRVLSYQNKTYSYKNEAYREVDVSSYQILITVEVEFIDNVKNNVIYKGKITEYGLYDFEKESEEDGLRRAVEKIVTQIMQSSIQSW